MTPVIAVLAHGEATRVDEATKARIRCAFTRVSDLVLEPDGCVAIIFMAGVGKEVSSLTLAERMVMYAREHIEKTGLDERSLRLHYNSREPHVWGTLEEMRWAADLVKSVYRCPYIEYVTNKRHGIRVRATARMLGLPDPHVIESSDPPSPFLHEAGAYMKLATYTIGPVYRSVQALRRMLYSGG